MMNVIAMTISRSVSPAPVVGRVWTDRLVAAPAAPAVAPDASAAGTIDPDATLIADIVLFRLLSFPLNNEINIKPRSVKFGRWAW
jgi:hypothetical protein